MNLPRSQFLLLSLSVLMVVAGCRRGQPTQKPPVHIVQDMYHQPKYLPQESSEYFSGDGIMREPVPGTVARGWLKEDSLFFTGIDPATGQEVKFAPLPMTMANLKRGQDRYDIFCSVCHGYTGDGKGIVISKGFVPPPSFHLDRLREATEGYLYRVIREGYRNMPSYAQQIPVSDRWAIVLYLRALQRSQNATISDLPKNKR